MAEKKTSTINMKIAPSDRKLLEIMSDQSSRTLSNEVTYLIREEAKRLGIKVEDQ